MLELSQEKHLIYFDEKKQYFASYTFSVKNPFGTEALEPTRTFTHEIWIAHSFTYEWQSDCFNIELLSSNKPFGLIPFSIQTYLQLYEDPRKYSFRFNLKSKIESLEQLFGAVVGKLIIKTSFVGNPFLLPLQMEDMNDGVKTIAVVTMDDANETVVCSGVLKSTVVYESVNGFMGSEDARGYKMHVFEVGQNVSSGDICVLKGVFERKELQHKKTEIRVLTRGCEFELTNELTSYFMSLRNIMEVEQLTIVQGVRTEIEEAHLMVFVSDRLSFESRVFRALIHDKIKEKWLVEGMVHYERTQKQFQECTAELVDALLDGEEFFPLCEGAYSFDRTWRLKARWLYHVLANFKTAHDSGSASLATLIIEESRKGRVTSTMLFRRLKNKYMKKNFRMEYEHQFVKSTGVPKIFYQLVDVKRENRVKIILRQKALANKYYRLYNAARIKLEQSLKVVSPIMTKIIAKNKFQSPDSRKELAGPLAVPKFLKSLAYFKGGVTVQTDASDQIFEMQLREENIIEEKQNATAKVRVSTRKTEAERAQEVYSWIMVDTSQIYPAVYKNENVKESTILERIKKKYDSEQEEIKVLNCISSKDHAGSDKVCRALMDKLKISEEHADNSSLAVRIKILQIMPAFLTKSTDSLLWKDYLALLCLFEPVCHDYSNDGFQLLLSLLDSLAALQYVRPFHYFFQQFHRVMLSLLLIKRQQELLFKCHFYGALLKWKSRHCIEILKAVADELELCSYDTPTTLPLLKVIITNLLPFIQLLNLPPNHLHIRSIHIHINRSIDDDFTFQLFALNFEYEAETIERNSEPLQFLKWGFGMVQKFRNESISKYWRSVEALKNVLCKHRRRYCVDLQLNLSANKAYFVAQYIWRQMCSKEALEMAQVRLQWLKVYRALYFYFTPVATHVLLRDNPCAFLLDARGVEDVLNNIAQFMPDIKWFSGYESKTAKKLKEKYELMNENKRKKRVEEYHFSQKNCITIFLKEHPTRDTWEDLSREALRIFIQIYGGKEQSVGGTLNEKYKNIQEGLKKIEQKLKRGRMPEMYSYDKLKDEVLQLLDLYDEVQNRITDVFVMVEDVLREMNEERRKKEQESKDDMLIRIMDDIVQNEEEEDEPRMPEIQDEQNQSHCQPISEKPQKDEEQEIDQDLHFVV